MGTGKASILYFLKKEVKAVLEGRILLLQLVNRPNTTQKMKFFILDFFSKCDQLTFIEEYLMENLIFCTVKALEKLCVSTKFPPHQIRQNYVLRSAIEICIAVLSADLQRENSDDDSLLTVNSNLFR